MSDMSKEKAENTLEKELRLNNEFPLPTYEEWKAQVEADLKGASFEKKLITKTYEGIDLKPIYTRKDIENLPHLKNFPGSENYVRGTRASGYTDQSWLICQEIPYADAEDFNAALKNDLERGQTAVDLTLDSATKLGLDADFAGVEKVGDSGLSISAKNSLARALKDVDLEKYPIFVRTGFSSLPILALLAAHLNEKNFNLKNLRGSFEADPIGYIAENGSLPVSWDFIFDEMAKVVNWSTENMPNVKTIGVDGSLYHNSGASAVQELALVLATGNEYFSVLIDKGIPAEEIANKLRFTFAVGPFYFMEIAKLRAAKILWSKILEAYGVDENDRKMNIHVRTSRHNQTMIDPYVNMLRTTTEAFSAIVGGIDSMHTNPFDESFAVPDQFSRRIARNTQILLKEESHLDKLIDPAGGSYFVESLTSEVAEKAWKLFQEIDAKGGMIKSLEANYPQTLIAETDSERRKNLSNRKDVLVGTNMYANGKEKKIERQKLDKEKFHKKRTEYLQKLRVSGDNGTHQNILEKLQNLTDKNSTDLIGTCIEAFAEGATIGEIAKTTRVNAGDAVKISKVKIHRASEIFEELRDKAIEYQASNGSKPKVFLATMGPLKQHKPRADFSTGFFEVGGFEVIYQKGFDSSSDASEAAINAGAQVVVICSTDETYPEIVPQLVRGLKSKNKDIVIILAGYPKDQIEEHKKSGVDDFIYLGCDAYELLNKLFNKIR